jgi:O-antigen ligase
MGEKSREKKERKEENYSLAQERPVGGQNSILWWIIFIGTCLISLAPFIVGFKYFFPFVGPKSLYFMALVEIIFAAWLILAISSPKYRPRINAIALSLVVYLLIFIVSSFLGIDFSRSFWSKYERMTGILMQLHLFAFFLVTSSTFKRKEDWLKILGVFTLAATIMSVITILALPPININLLGRIAESSRGGATLGNSSFLGTYLLFNLFLAIYLFFNTEKKLKIIIGFALAIIGVALLFSTARAALLSSLFGLLLLFFLWLAFAGKEKFRLIGKFFLAAMCLAVIVGGFLATQKGSFVQQAIINQVGETFGGRFVVWQDAWQSFLEKPVLGWGPENFEIIFTRHFNPCLFGDKCGGDIWYDRAHNIVIDTLITTGIVGMISYLGIFAAVFYVLWRKFFKNEISFWAAGIFSVALLAYFIQNLTVFDMVNSYMMLFLILGFVGNAASLRENIDTREKPLNWLMTVLIICLLLLSLSVFVFKPLRANNYVIRSLEFAPASSERLDFYQKSLAISPVGKYQIRDFFAQADMEFVQSYNLASTSIENLNKEFDFVTKEMEKSTKESPLDYRSFLKLGQVYNIYAIIKNDTMILSLAQKVLERSIELSPTNQQGYWALAQTELYLGNTQKALSLAEEAQALESRSLQANMILIQIAQIIGNKTLAQQKFDEAIKINSAWATSLKGVLGQ